MTSSEFDSSEDLLAFVKAMAQNLSELGFNEAAVELTDWWSTGYTTSSEFLGELGLVCGRIIKRDGARLPACLAEDLERCLAESRAAFPQ
jgi:hypothetical protein